MKKYRIIKRQGESEPYIPQHRGAFGRWINYQVLTLRYPYQKDAKYATLEEAKEALDNLIERKKPPIVVEEIEG